METSYDTSVAVPDCITSPESRELFARLEAKIQDALHLLADLRRQQNALIPAVRVPSDTLFHIFSLVQSDFCDMLRASQVCSQWRAVASAPSLWTHITLRSVGQTQELLARSGTAPIHAFVPMLSSTTGLSVLSSRHIHRLWSFVVNSSEVAGIRESMSVLAGPAPNLQKLDLFIWDARRYRNSPRLPDDWPFWKEQADFGSHLSALHTLKLHGVYFPPGSPIFGNVRVLCLSRQPTVLLNSTTVGRIVSHIPQLEELSVDDVGKPSTERAIANTSFSAALPRLRRLTMHTVPPPFPGNLLDALTLPPTVKIDPRVVVDGDEEVPIPRFSAHPVPPCIGTRSVECTIDRRDITFRMRREAGAVDPDLVRQLRSLRPYERVLAMFAGKALVDGSGLERYTLEYAERAGPLARLDWQGLLVKMDGLRVLTVIGVPEKRLLELFDTLWLDERKCRCASLEVIHIRGAECTKGFWRKLRAVARTWRPTLRTVRISDARGDAEASDDVVQEVARLVETLELETAGADAKGDGESDDGSDLPRYDLRTLRS